jgi:mRNA interferase HigB
VGLVAHGSLSSQYAKRSLDRNFAHCEDYSVRVISRKKIRDASKEHPEWETSLSAWYRVAKNADWAYFPDVKQSWRNSDNVGTCIVFEISHNKCRLIAWVNYRSKKIFIRHIASHADYDKEKWKDDCDCD